MTNRDDNRRSPIKLIAALLGKHSREIEWTVIVILVATMVVFWIAEHGDFVVMSQIRE